MLPPLIESLGLTDPGVYFCLFLAASLLMLWRLEAMLDHGLEGTALGTLVMPYCSGLGNLLFVFILTQRGGNPGDVLTNALVNNVSNLTLLLGLPALFWGLQVTGAAGKAGRGAGAGAKGRGRVAKGKGDVGAGGDTGAQINRLSLLLTLVAVLFFTGAAWLLGEDGQLSRTDGLLLVGLFLFWQCFQVFDVAKHNVRQRVSFGPMFYVDVVLVLGSAVVIYESLDWLVAWISAQKTGFISAGNLGWLSGWLMVLPNALLALYWGAKRRADVVYASQVGDGHICIPLGIGLLALLTPVAVPPFFLQGLLLLLGACGLHALFLLIGGGLPRWGGAVLLAAYGWFVWTGLLA